MHETLATEQGFVAQINGDSKGRADFNMLLEHIKDTMKTVVSFLSPFCFLQCDYNSKLGSGISAHLPKKFAAMFSLNSCSS